MPDPARQRPVTDLMVALVIATAVFIGFAVGFRVQPYEPKTEGQGADPGVFSLDENPELAGPEHAHLITWLEYKDPTHVTLPPEGSPNRNHPNRNWVNRDSEYFPEPRDLPKVELKLVDQDPYTFELRPPLEPPTDLNSRLTMASRTRVTLPRLSAPPSTVEPGVYWVDESGRAVQEIPRLSLTDLELDGVSVHGPTQCDIRPIVGTGQLPRVTVNVSCGSRRLDLIALKHLARWVRGLTVGIERPQRAAWLTTPRQVYVIWKYAPGISTKPLTDRLEKEAADEGNAG